MVGAERIIEEIAYATGLDPLEVRKRNFYGTDDRNLTPYHQTVEDNIIADHRGQARGDERLRGAARRRSAQANRQSRGDQARHRADAGEVRHLVHGDALQSGRRAGAHLQRRQRAPEPRRHRDGAGPVRQGGAGRGRGTAARSRPHQGRWRPAPARCPNTSATAASSGADLNGKAAQAAVRTLKARLDRLRGRALVGAGGPGRVPAQPGAGRQPGGLVPDADQAGLYGPRVAVGDRLLQDAEDPLGPRHRAGQAVLLLTPMAPPARKWRSTR